MSVGTVCAKISCEPFHPIMKENQTTQSKRRSKRTPWSGKNLRFIRAALRVWELKQRAKGIW